MLWGQEFPVQDDADYWIVKFVPEGSAAKITSPASDVIHEKVDQMPVFPGREAALKAYFEKALVDKVYFKGGTITLKLVIDKSGQPKDIGVLTSLNKETDTMVLMEARKMPKWQPGKQNGKVVPVKYTLRFTFPPSVK